MAQKRIVLRIIEEKVQIIRLFGNNERSTGQVTGSSSQDRAPISLDTVTKFADCSQGLERFSRQNHGSAT